MGRCHCAYKESETEKGKTYHHFNWTFDKQYGYITIIIRKSDNKMSNSSLIDTEKDSPYKFARPLGLYNDGTLLPVFYAALRTISITPAGEYAE